MPTVTVSVDPAAFASDVAALLKGSPLAAEFGADGKISVTSWNLAKLLEIAQAATASVEVVKTNIVAQADPDGSRGIKFSSDLAAHTAVNVACDVIRFGGPFGWALNALDRPLLNVLIEAVMTGFKGRNWLADAKSLLHL